MYELYEDPHLMKLRDSKNVVIDGSNNVFEIKIDLLKIGLEIRRTSKEHI